MASEDGVFGLCVRRARPLPLRCIVGSWAAPDGGSWAAGRRLTSVVGADELLGYSITSRNAVAARPKYTQMSFSLLSSGTILRSFS